MKTQGLRSDPEGDVELVEAFWNNERLGLGGATVPIPLVIADVLASLDGRNIEAARELREIWLRGVKSCAATRARRIARDRRRAGGAQGGVSGVGITLFPRCILRQLIYRFCGVHKRKLMIG